MRACKDAHICTASTSFLPDTGFFAVLDGHGGEAIARAAAKKLLDAVETVYRATAKSAGHGHAARFDDAFDAGTIATAGGTVPSSASDSSIGSTGSACLGRRRRCRSLLTSTKDLSHALADGIIAMDANLRERWCVYFNASTIWQRSLAQSGPCPLSCPPNRDPLGGKREKKRKKNTKKLTLRLLSFLLDPFILQGWVF